MTSDIIRILDHPGFVYFRRDGTCPGAICYELGMVFDVDEYSVQRWFTGQTRMEVFNQALAEIERRGG